MNGVPLRRVNQRYVIATSAKVDVSSVDVSAIDDNFFAREKVAKKEGEEALFAAGERGTVTSDARKAAQKSVDDKLAAAVNKVDMLPAYLSAKFTLSRGDRPHAMKF
jgi:large subunit ribosomal protein L6e